MSVYRKLPVEIQAFQYDGDLIASNGEYYVPLWAVQAHINGILHYESTNERPADLLVKTLEGDMHVSVNDYVIQGVNRELYPCKPDIFEKTYEFVR